MDKYQRAVKVRADQHRFWFRRSAAVEQALRDGLSTCWVSRMFNVESRAVRSLRREMGLG